MNHFKSGLSELVDLFCEGDLTPEQAAELEALVSQSEEARQYLLDCFQVHCELAWELRGLGEEISQPIPSDDLSDPYRPEPDARPYRGWTLAAVAVVLLLSVTLGLTSLFRGGNRGGESHSASIARIAQTSGVRWRDEAPKAIDAPLLAGSSLAIQEGLVEVAFDSGARIIVQGPAEVELQSPSSVVLRRGSLTAEVPVEARGFAVHTPNSTVVDLGTRFGVACQAGQTDVEVFLGSVLLQLPSAQAGGGPQEQPLGANSAARITGAPNQGALKIESLLAGSRHFVQSMKGSAAQLQALAEDDPHLIHFYPFEGTTTKERCRDRRGNLDLHEVAMRDGDGGGRLKFTRTGPDLSTQVAVPYRAKQFGGNRGVGLQSDSEFQPPPSMTVELLVNLSGTDMHQEGFIACAVATRHDADHCGFLVTAMRDGELACLLEGGAEWLQSGFKFIPNRWYYVASTFRAKNVDTEVNTFVADLSKKNPKLNWVVQNRIALGMPAAGALGVGKGADGKMANAYPWTGQLGLIAIYDTLLNRQTLENHLTALTPQVASAPSH
jgi:ferric-dicitrate binding protein FerR (iron transport regulator)